MRSLADEVKSAAAGIHRQRLETRIWLGPWFFSYEVLFGDRPPFLKDFLDDSVSASVVQQTRRKVVRISAEEFDVEV